MTENSSSKNEIIIRLRKRARTLRSVGIFVLTVVASLMVSAGWLFFNASSIAEKDIRRPDPRPFQDQIIEINKSISSIRDFYPSQNLKDLSKKLKEQQQSVTDYIEKQGVKIKNSYSNIYYLNETNNQDSGYRSTTSNKNLNNDYLYKKIGVEFELPEIPKGIRFPEHDGFYILHNIEENEEKEFVRNTGKQLVDISGEIPKFNDFVTTTSNFQHLWIKELNEIGGRYESSKSELEILLTRLEELKKIVIIATDYELAAKYGINLELKKKNGNMDIHSPADGILFLVSTNIIRFGPMVIIFFFSGILISLYRYCIRLAAYYDARADALDLINSSINHDVFINLVNSLSPENYDFGKMPKSPTDQAIELTKLIASSK